MKPEQKFDMRKPGAVLVVKCLAEITRNNRVARERGLKPIRVFDQGGAR